MSPKRLLYLPIIFLLGSCGDFPDMNGISKKVVLSNFKTEVNLESRVWGLAGNHETIKLTSPNADCDTIIFHTDQIFYQAKGNDTLLIYTNRSSYSEEPITFCGSIQLDIRNLNNYDEIKRMEKEYQKLGLERLTVYEK